MNAECRHCGRSLPHPLENNPVDADGVRHCAYCLMDELASALIEARAALNGGPNTRGLHDQINSAITKATGAA